VRYINEIKLLKIMEKGRGQKSRDFELDIWNTDFRVIISEKMIKRIKEKIKIFGGPLALFKTTHITPAVYYRLINKKGSSIKNYQEILINLDLNLDEAEKEIIGLTYNGCNKIYPFKKYFNPLLFRIVCHIIGDGNVSKKYGTCRWIQHKNNSSWLIDIMKQELGFALGRVESTNKTCEMITIPAYFAILIKNILGFGINSIKSAETIEKFIDYPKSYRLQFLAAFIVDEGHIRYKNARSLIISQSDENMLKMVSKLLDSLGYHHSKIYREISKAYLEKGMIKKIFRLNIYSLGVNAFNKDIQEMVTKHGKYAGLWHKQKQLECYVASLKIPINKKSAMLNMDKILGHILRTEDYISYRKLRENPFISNELEELGSKYLINKFYELAKQGKVKRLERGFYKIQKF